MGEMGNPEGSLWNNISILSWWQKLKIIKDIARNNLILTINEWD